MKIKYIIITILAVFVTFACEDSDIIKGGGVGYVGTLGASMKRANNTAVIATIATSKRVTDTLIVEITISDSTGVIIGSADKVDNSIITLGFGPSDAERSFTIDYENPQLDGIVNINFTVTNVSGDFNQIFNDNFVIRVEGAVQPLPVVAGAISIKEAKTMPGELVSIVGYVNTPDYGFSNGQYYIQDDSAGINIIHFGNFGAVQRGNIVKLEGTIGEFAGQVQIDVDVVEILSESTEVPIPISITADQLTVDSPYQGMLVSVGDVTLNSASEWPIAPQAGGSGVNVNATSGGSSFIIRIDRGESFYDGSAAPTGAFTLSGVLGRFNADPQVYPFVEGDVSTGGGGSNEDLFELPFVDDFESCTDDFATPENFNEVFAAGSKTDRGWGCRQEGVGSSRGVRASSFGGDEGSDNAWLISSKKFDLFSASEATLSIDVKSAFSGDGDLKVLWSASYDGSSDPTDETWTEISAINSTLPTKGSGTYKTVSASLDAALGSSIYIALQFFDGTSSSSASFEIDNFKVESGSTGGGGGGGGTTTPFALPFTDDFESCTTVGDFNIPTNWVELVADGAKTDRGWGCRAFGRNESSGPRASAFGGADGTDDAWLISAQPFDLSTATSPELIFWLESRFSGPGTVEVYWSSDFDGGTSLPGGTWNQISGIDSQIPAEGSEIFTEVSADLSVITANQAYLAFRYFGGTSSASVALTIDDVSIADK